MSLLPRHVVIDDFLPRELHAALLDLVVAQQGDFTRSMMRKGQETLSGDGRKSWVSGAEFGDLAEPLRAGVRAALPALFEGLAIAPFEPAKIELELSAHRDGDYYHPHIDTFISEDRDGLPTDRVFTAAYYFHFQPRGFTGGEFRIHPFAAGRQDPVAIEPKDNRLWRSRPLH